MKRLLKASVVLLVLPASAAAAPRHYFPKPHQHCRAHYVRRFVKVSERKHGRTVSVRRLECVYAAAKPPTLSTVSSVPTAPGTPTLPGTPGTPGTPSMPSTPTATGTVPTSTSVTVRDSMTTWFSLSAGVSSGGQELFSRPVTYTVTDATNGRFLAAFAGTSNSYSSCSVVYSVSGGIKTYSGQPVPPVAACNLTTFSMPAADAAVVTATFAGDSTYAPSTSARAAFS